MIDLKAKPFYLDDEAIGWVHDTIEGMTLEEKAGQLFCAIYKSNKWEDIEEVQKVFSPGGGMYRSLTVEDAIDMTTRLQKSAKIPMLIAANLEKGGNGIVVEGTLFGSPMEVAATDDVEMAAKLGKVCAREGKAVGGNWAFAPIIDIDTNWRNPITNTRTYGSDANRVAQMGVAYTKAVQAEGLAASIKHFPGDGQDERDQHLVTSINDMLCEEWDATYGKAYTACIDAGALTCMVGHIMQPAYTRKFNPSIANEDILPGSLSKELMGDLLRGQLGFNGMIVTDASTMAGFTLAMSRKKAIPYSIEAGADMFLFTRNLEEDFQDMVTGIKTGILSARRLEEALTRILATKAALRLYKGIKQLDITQSKEIVGCSEHRKWALECADRAITLVKEQKNVLPLSTDKYKKILIYTMDSDMPSADANVVSAPIKFLERLKAEGFRIDLFQPKPGLEGHTIRGRDIIENYDLIIYVANMPTKSNQTILRLEWDAPMGVNCAHYINDIPTMFISLENPYHLIDVPRMKTFINTYSNNDAVIEMLVEKLMGRSKFKGISPVDPFLGKWDTRL